MSSMGLNMWTIVVLLSQQSFMINGAPAPCPENKFWDGFEGRCSSCVNGVCLTYDPLPPACLCFCKPDTASCPSVKEKVAEDKTSQFPVPKDDSAQCPENKFWDGFEERCSSCVKGVCLTYHPLPPVCLCFCKPDTESCLSDEENTTEDKSSPFPVLTVGIPICVVLLITCVSLGLYYHHGNCCINIADFFTTRFRSADENLPNGGNSRPETFGLIPIAQPIIGGDMAPEEDKPLRQARQEMGPSSPSERVM